MAIRAIDTSSPLIITIATWSLPLFMSSYATVPDDLFGNYSRDEEDTNEWGYGELSTSTDPNDQDLRQTVVPLSTSLNSKSIDKTPTN